MWSLEANSAVGLLAADRPIVRPTVRFLTVVLAVDRSVDHKLANDPAVDRPVDWAIFREQRLSGGRPALGCARLCTSVDRPVDRPLARSTVRSAGKRPKTVILGI